MPDPPVAPLSGAACPAAYSDHTRRRCNGIVMRTEVAHYTLSCSECVHDVVGRRLMVVHLVTSLHAHELFNEIIRALHKSLRVTRTVQLTSPPELTAASLEYINHSGP